MISVIIPVFNVETYVKECIESVIQQTYVDLEVIIIDDGSTDNSGKICDQYAEFDRRIKVIHQKNQGLSAARNQGLDIAKGDYIVFVDSDDYIEKDMIERLYKALVVNNADLVICNIKKFYGETQVLNEIKSPLKDEIVLPYEAIEKLFQSESWYYVVSWNKIYSKELWNQIRFPIGYIHEDEAVIHRIFKRCTKIVILEDQLYYYRQHDNSIMHRNTMQKTDIYYALADRLKFLERTVSKASLRKLTYRFWYHFPHDFFLCYENKKYKVYKNRMKKALRKAFPVMRRVGFFTWKDCMSVFLLLWNPFLYKKLFYKEERVECCKNGQQ